MLAKPLLLVDVAQEKRISDIQARFYDNSDMDFDEGDLSHDEEDEEDEEITLVLSKTALFEEDSNNSPQEDKLYTRSDPGPLNLKKNKRKNFLPRSIHNTSLAMGSPSDNGYLPNQPKESLTSPDFTNNNYNYDLNLDDSEVMDLSSKPAVPTLKPTIVKSEEQDPLPNATPSKLGLRHDSAALEDYAENTMKELLGIYGLSDVSESVVKPPSSNKNVKDAHPPETNIPHTFDHQQNLFLRSPEGPYGHMHPLTFPHFPLAPSVMTERGLLPGPAIIPFPSPLFGAANHQAHYFVPKGSGNADEPGPSGAGTFGPTTSKDKSPCHMDYTRYVKRFASAVDCGLPSCREMNYREHFHCVDCNSRVFVKKEEMIRHFKWHKKRDESLQHGFMRYSPTDDCSDRFSGCSHNRKQTHYHCLKEGCDKVYISTSDVQMHANYHRKDSAILQEGFQRFRGCEDCGQSYCSYKDQRTTHFHCRRSGCQFTFKNKADMEKHKSYHIKDEQLNKDGFKKFMKHEDCPFKDCRFSRVCNHIHCIREGCSYVLHSSGQLFSHKRKHERRDTELAYRKLRLAQSMMRSMDPHLPPNPILARNIPEALSHTFPVTTGCHVPPQSHLVQALTSLPPSTSCYPATSSADLFPSTPREKVPSLCSSPNSEPMSPSNTDSSGPAAPYDDSTANSDSRTNDTSNDSYADKSDDDANTKLCQSYSEAEICTEDCPLGGTEHTHCLYEDCGQTFPSVMVTDHIKLHKQQDYVSSYMYTEVTSEQQCHVEPDCPHNNGLKHYHCDWVDCSEVVLPSEGSFKRLDHYKMHQYSQSLSLSTTDSHSLVLNTSADAVFRRKRGRPPKNRVIEFPGKSPFSEGPHAIFTSFKLPKRSNSVDDSVDDSDKNMRTKSCLTISCINVPHVTSTVAWMDVKPEIQEGFYVFTETVSCPDSLCIHTGQKHYHCSQPRCYYVTDREDILLLHSKDFHDSIEILEEFYFFDRAVDCRYESCTNNKINRHFHCGRPDCGFSFVGHSAMASHDEHHRSQEPQPQPETQTDVVKAKGTFYPQSSSAPVSEVLSTANRIEESISIKSEEQEERAENSNISELDSCSTKTGSSVFSTSPYLAAAQTLYTPDQPCGRPFCKLKKREHYHCSICNQAFSDLDKLEPHIAKHSCVLSPFGPRPEEDNELGRNAEKSPLSSMTVSPLQGRFMFDSRFPTFSPSPYFFGHGAFSMGPPMSGLAYGSDTLGALQGSFGTLKMPGIGKGFPSHSGFPQDTPIECSSQKRPSNETVTAPDLKRGRLPSIRSLKDEPVPDGYVRYRFNEDCAYPHCGYREHQTHFHCTRKDCGYSFCDKTRFVQHTARHERLDTLMGGDFHQFRANVSCGRPKCAYLTAMQNRASHFHCLKCDFVCTDTNKVVAHRRQHQKLDSIMAAGFKKFTPSQSCSISGCHHNQRQTHYHCLDCQFAVLGLSQMSAHRYRHEHQ